MGEIAGGRRENPARYPTVQECDERLGSDDAVEAIVMAQMLALKERIGPDRLSVATAAAVRERLNEAALRPKPWRVTGGG